MSNYPPGVTGNEFEIAGPDREFDDYRECSSEGFTVRTIDLYGEKAIKDAVERLQAFLQGSGDTLGIPVALGKLRTALSDIQSVDVDGQCPFGGDVTIQQYMGVESWECPVCRVIHEKEID